MSHFAEIDSNGNVLRVIVAEQDFIDSGAVGNPSNWIQTSCNTQAAIHKLGGIPLRKNYAGIGYTYDKVLDAFIPPKPFNSWILNKEKCVWESPVAMPKDGKPYSWDESTLSWKIL